jgi:hypothetical protein
MIENREMQNHDLISISKFQIPRVGGVKETHDKNDEITKYETTPFQSFRYRELEESRVNTLHHRSPEVAKCETPKSRNRHINKDSISDFCRLGNQRSKEL